MSTTTPLRLESIRICGYRAFPHLIEIPLKGKSLVLYGENGSGKSSFGKAVRDLLAAGKKAPEFDDHRYRYADPSAHRNVTVTFTDAAIPPLTWNAGARPISHTHYDPSSRGTKLFSGSIELRTLHRDSVPLKAPSEVLNEARLTAIGLCLYLSALSKTVPARLAKSPSILVLDDVLLSLDMAHRLPLLRILRDRFGSWQVLLLTHDRAWYEIARQQLNNGWIHHELFTQQVGDYEQPLLRQDQDHLGWAIDFLVQGHVKAAAVHVRTKFEEVLKSACIELGLPVKYHADPRKVPASDLWAAVSGAKWEEIPSIGRAIDAHGKCQWWQPAPTERPVVPSGLKERIGHALSWVMNPLSHSQSVDRYRQEIEDALFAVNELEEAIRYAIAMRQAGPVLLRQMLLGFLKTRT